MYEGCQPDRQRRDDLLRSGSSVGVGLRRRALGSSASGARIGLTELERSEICTCCRTVDGVHQLIVVERLRLRGDTTATTAIPDRVAERAFHETPAADAAYLVGGGALFASAFLQWVARGTGSGLRGHDLVDAVVALGREVPLLSTGRLTILWYLVPALGTASWIACGLTGARSRASRIVAGRGDRGGGARRPRRSSASSGSSRLGWGPKVAVLGALALCARGLVAAPPVSQLGAVAAHLLERADRVQALVVRVERRRRSSRR